MIVVVRVTDRMDIVVQIEVKIGLIIYLVEVIYVY